MISENHIADVIEEYIPHLLESQNKNEKRSKKGKINTKGILLLENGIGKFTDLHAKGKTGGSAPCKRTNPFWFVLQ